jgi:hypothetical protein
MPEQFKAFLASISRLGLHGDATRKVADLTFDDLDADFFS